MIYEILVTCDACGGEMARSQPMSKDAAESLKRRLSINPFGAPRCSDCKNLEPYSDINLMHTITVQPVKQI